MRAHSIAIVVLVAGCASAPERPGSPAAPATVRGAHYSATPDTLYYGLWQLNTIYYVHGRDTLRLPGQNFRVRAEEWSEGADGLHVAEQQVCVGATRCALANSFTISPRGRILVADGQPLPATRDGQRLVTILPEGRQLEQGVQWPDSGVLDSAGISGNMHRLFRVEKVIQSQGRSLAEIVGDGTMHLHGTFRFDSTRTMWLDVSGSVKETHWFDVHAGRMVSNFATARLTGWGSMPNPAGGMDTLPAGVTFDIKDRAVTADRARLLARVMPGRDSSITTNAQNVLFLHTVGRDGDKIDAGVARPDGWVRTVSERFANGRPLSYDAVWSDTNARCCTVRHIERRGDSLFVRRDGHDTTVAVPAVTWAVSDAMNQELLVPVLLTLPHDNSPHPVAVYRPFDGKWTVWQTTVKETEGVYLVHMAVSAQDPEEILIISKSGDLLFAEQPKGTQPWMRMPPSGSTRRAAVDVIMKRLNPVRNVASTTTS